MSIETDGEGIPIPIMPREECTDHCFSNSERRDGYCIECGNVCTEADAPFE